MLIVLHLAIIVRSIPSWSYFYHILLFYCIDFSYYFDDFYLTYGSISFYYCLIDIFLQSISTQILIVKTLGRSYEKFMNVIEIHSNNFHCDCCNFPLHISTNWYIFVLSSPRNKCSQLKCFFIIKKYVLVLCWTEYKNFLYNLLFYDQKFLYPFDYDLRLVLFGWFKIIQIVWLIVLRYLG